MGPDGSSGSSFSFNQSSMNGFQNTADLDSQRIRQNHPESYRERLEDTFRQSSPAVDPASNPLSARSEPLRVLQDHAEIHSRDAGMREAFTSSPQMARSSVEDLLNPATPLAARSRPLMSPQTFAASRRLAPTGALLGADFPSSGNSPLGKRNRGDLPMSSYDLAVSAPPSKRATPDPLAYRSTPQMSRTTSHSSGSIELDDVELDAYQEIYGFDPRQDKRRFRQEQKAQKEMMEAFRQPSKHVLERMQQEQADEEMARRLQAEINGDAWAAVHAEPARSPAGASSDGASLQSAAHHLGASTPFSGYRLPPQTSAIEGNTNRPHADRPEPSYAPDAQQRMGLAGHGISNTNPYGGWGDDLEIIDGSDFKPNQNRALSRPLGERHVVDLSDFTSSSYPDYSTGSSLFPTTMQKADAKALPSSIYGDQTSSFGGSRQSPYGKAASFTGSLTSGGALGTSSYVPTTRTAWSRNDSYGHSSLLGYSGSPFGHSHSPYTYTDEAENAEALKDLLNNIRPDEEDNLGASERGDGTPDGMAENANLYKYQQKGLAWLSKMEEGTNKGSILADDMGLGKTVQAIALMISRKSLEPACKTTLIVAPVALIRQWESEVRSKLKQSHQLSTFVYHGSGKSAVTYDQIQHYDVVITTYGTLTADHKKKMELAKKMRDAPGYRARAAELPVLTGDQCRFYRCILDEAQNIKNKSAKSALAAYEVDAKYRLCMTGTPMMNNVVELFSLVHFLRIQPYCQWEKFNMDFARPLRTGSSHGRESAMRKLQALCKAVMLRRTKKSKMDGKPLVQLPDRQMEEVHAIFDKDEQAFYSALEAKTQLTYNKFLKAGTVGRNYSNILTLLLRLRQACCHPHLIRDFAIVVEATPERFIENAKELPPQIVQRIIENEIADCPICIDVADNYTIFNPCGHHACTECFCSLSDSSRDPNTTQSDASGSKAKFRCHTCRGDTDPAKVTDYVHFKILYQPEKAALEGLGKLPKNFEDDSASSSDDGDDGGDDDDDDDDDSSDAGSLKNFVVDDHQPIEWASHSDSEDSDDNLDDTKPVVLCKSEQSKKPTPKDARSARAGAITPRSAKKESDDDVPHTSKDGNNTDPSRKAADKVAEPSKKRHGRNRKKSKKQEPRKTLAQLKKEGMRNAASRKKYFRRLAKSFIPSAKIDKCLEILLKVTSGSDPEKVIVFSQFTSLLDLLEVPMNDRQMVYRRFDGSMDATSRNRSVIDFTNNPNTKIMLVSLKAGNAGLNLTAASHVIILDPFWNPYIEEQAIDRAHRIGQRRTVHVHRILIAETVEDRILQLQKKKRDLIEGALDEGASNSIGRLGVRELAFLFGIRS